MNPSPSTIPRRVWTSSAWLVAGRLFGSACTVGILYVLARHLDGPGFGQLTFWLAVFLVLDGLVDFGAGQVAVQRAARSPGEASAVLITARRARLAVAVTVVMGLAMFARFGGVEGGGFLAVAGLYQLSHVLELSTLGWRDRIAWRSPVLVRASASLASLLAVLWLLGTGEDRPLAFLVAIAVGSTAGNLALHLLGRRGLPPTRGVRPAPAGPFLRASLPIGAAAVCQQLYFHVDNLFVRLHAGDEVVGHYNVAVRVMSLSIMGGVFAAGASLPWLSRAHAAGALGPAVRRLTAATGALGVAVAGTLLPFRAEILGLFGPAFLAANGALAWLLAASVAIHVGAPLLTAVIASGRGKSVLWIAAMGLVINVLGNACLLGPMGIEGAAAATLATEVWVAAASALVISRAAPRPA